MKKISIIGLLIFALIVLSNCGGGGGGGAAGSGSGSGGGDPVAGGVTVYSLTANPPNVAPQKTSVLSCDATGDVSWSVTGGVLSGSGASRVWTAPLAAGNYTATCTGTNSKSTVLTVPKWTSANGTGIQSSDINKSTGEIFSVTTGSNPSLMKFNTDGTIVWNKPVFIPAYTVASVDFLKLSPDASIIYLFWRKPEPIDLGGTSGGIAVSGFNSSGSHLWTMELDSSAGCPLALATDNTGAYAIGMVAAYNDNAVFKIGTAGNLVSQTSISGTVGTDGAAAIDVADGYVHIAGGVGSSFSGFTYAGGFSDSYVVTLDASNLARTQVNEWGTVGGDDGVGVTVISSGTYSGVYVSIYTWYPDTYYLAKYDYATGGLVWIKPQATAGKIIADSTGLYIGGKNLSKVGFDGVPIWTKTGVVAYDVMVFGNTVFTTTSTSQYMLNYLDRYDTATGAKLE